MSTYHVLPESDIREHREGNDCPCHPDQYVVGNNWLLVHHAWDAREAFEIDAILLPQGRVTRDQN